MGLFNGISRLFSGGGKPQLPSPSSLFDGQQGLFQGRVPIAPGVTAPNFFIGTPEGLFEGERKVQPGLPHETTFAAIYNTAAKTYSYRWDEAYRHSRADALAMRRDCFLQGLLFERKFPTAQMPWHLEPDDKKDAKQVAVADYLKTCIDTLPNVTEMMMMLLEALWYGRAGAQIVWDWKQVKGMRSLVPEEVIPVNGDKIQFEWDGTPQVRLYGGTSNEMLPGDQVDLNADTETRYTDRGLMLRLARPYWRDRFVIHSHDVIDADFQEADMAGGRFGVGIRHWIYWFWWLKSEIASYIMDFLERTGTGFTVYYYDPGNPTELANVKQIAKQQGRNTWIVWPRTPGDKGATSGVERIEPNVTGANVLKDLLSYYDGYIERFIIGQTMSSGADNESGLGGSGRADFAKSTKNYIIRHDSLKLQGTLSRDLVRVLLRNNQSNCERIYGRPLDFEVRWRFDMDSDDPEAKLAAGKTLVELGVKVKADELRAAAGFSKPDADDEQVGGQPPGAAPGAAPPGQKGTGLFEGKAPGANGAPKPNGKPNPDQDAAHRHPVRYNARMPKLSLYRYSAGDEQSEIPLGTEKDWEPFARWGSEQGGELARLSHEGTTDPYRFSDSLVALDAQLVDSKVPEEHREIANKIRDAAREVDTEGLLVSEASEGAE